MRIEMRDKWTGWCLATYIVKSTRQARERLRSILRLEERKCERFEHDQEEASARILNIVSRWEDSLGENATPEQIQAMKELCKIARQKVEWDEHALEYKRRKKG